MSNLLIEIGLEEVPARFVQNCLNDLKVLLTKEIEINRLNSSDTNIKVVGTYRRFSMIVTNLKIQQDDLNNTIYGPPIAIAKDNNGNWTQAGIGFAKKFNIPESELGVCKNEKEQEVVYFKQDEKGQFAKNLIPGIVNNIVGKMKLPIAMNWGAGIGPFIRPIQWLCVLLDGKVIDLEIFGIKSSNISYGHRFLSQNNNNGFLGKEIVIECSETYIEQLKNANVIVDPLKRQEIIKKQLEKFLKAEEIDKTLLAEVIYLVEFPTVLKVSFPEKFLSLPEEVLTQCLKMHQKAFLIWNNSKITNACLVVADSVRESNKSNIINGNQKVMLARLNDVQFFWDEDIKMNGFSNWNATLENIIFQDGLGSMSDKVERVCHICHTICDQLNLDKKMRDIIDRAAHRCKSDLVSNMVQELPSLQGIMGAYYAIYFKEIPEVAVAIKEHYQPRFDGDQLPKTMIGIVIAIADRLDTIISCYENDNIPTGSRDPWGIRRSMIAIVRMIIEYDLNLDLQLLLEDATLTLGKKVSQNTMACISFFKKRVETVILEEGINYDLVQLFDDIVGSKPLLVMNQAKLLMNLKEENADQYQLLVETTVRISKIINTVEVNQGSVTADLFKKPIETEVFQHFQELKLKQGYLEINDKTLKETISFCKLLEHYFDNVLINAEDPNVANNRQLFIKEVNQYFQTAGDWLKLTR